MSFPRCVTAGLTALVASVSVAVGAGSASAQAGCEGFGCEDTAVIPVGGGGGGGDGDGGAPAWNKVILGSANAMSQAEMLRLFGQTWDTCWAVVPDGPGGMSYDDALARAVALGASMNPPACPYLGNVDPTDWIILQWDRAVDVPVPAPEVQPGKAITGLAAYLETGMASNQLTPVVLDNPLPGGQLITITGEATYTIDWGDGSPKETTTRVGAPYAERHNGQAITHNYPRSGEMTIVVVATWTGRYQIGDGPVTEFATPRVVQGEVILPVEQVQAVRNR